MMTKLIRLQLLCSNLLILLLFETCCSQQLFKALTGYLCLHPNFVIEVPSVVYPVGCSLMCDLTANCQAFSLADGPCQLFVFDKCSKSVRDCSCSRRGQVFVKQQPGLEAGALCPSGYGDALCGVKYKLLDGTGNWRQSRQKCESESGLVIMADVMDVTEMNHVDKIYDLRSYGKPFFLGGFQPAGSQDNAGGWYWVGCNITLDGSLWNSREPNNGGGNENVLVRYPGVPKLADINEAASVVSSVLCECVSPFN